MTRDAFREALLSVMERKTHWAWPRFTSGDVAAERLHIHLEHEYEVYVRDFPVLVARAYVQCPIAEVRRELAENIYEEETGGLVAGRPHPELFLEYPKGLGMDLSRFEQVELLPGAARYRAFLDDRAQLGRILGEFAAGDGLARGGVTPARIAGGYADGLGPEVEPDQRTAIGQRIAEIAREIGYERWPDHARTRSTTSCCTFAQNSGMS